MRLPLLAFVRYCKALKQRSFLAKCDFMVAKRVSTGVLELDAQLEGGLPEGRSYLVTGAPGTGKTIFCIQFIYQALTEGEKAIYVSIDQKPAEIIEQASSLGWDLTKYIEKKQVIILDASPYFGSRVGAGKEKQVDVPKVVADLGAYVQRMDATRVVIDPVGPLILLRESTARIQDQARLLVLSLQSHMRTTNLLTCYAVPRVGEIGPHGVEEYLVSGTILLDMAWNSNQLVRTLVVEKMRMTAFELAQHQFSITKEKGIVLGPKP